MPIPIQLLLRFQIFRSLDGREGNPHRNLAARGFLEARALLGFERGLLDIVVEAPSADHEILVGDGAELAAEERLRFLADLDSGELFSATAQPWGIQHSDGRQLLVEGLFHPLTYHGVDAVLAHLQDITERRRVEAQLRLLERAIQSTGNGVVIADAREPGAPVTFINRAFEHITGYNAAEVIGQSCRQLGFEDSGESERAKHRPSLVHWRLATLKGGDPVRDNQGSFGTQGSTGSTRGFTRSLAN